MPALDMETAVTRLGFAFLVLLFSCAFGCAGFAQTSVSPAEPDQPAAAAKTHSKKSVHKKAGVAQSSPAQSGLPTSDEADKAARLAEGRKKFFEQSSGFEDNTASGPMSLDHNGSPTMGMKF